MTDETLIPVKPEIARHALVDAARYREMYEYSLRDPEGFWGEMAGQLAWRSPWTRVKNTSFEGEVAIRWFEDGRLNVTENCVDRHAAATPDKIAILWEGDEPGNVRRISYRELKDEVCRVANALISLGVKKGDRVTIYLPMVPEAAYAMLACARIGAIHSVVFGGFSPDSIRGG
ncbi:MAG: AMP-binding protein [Alphaproteobacteria bacterium]